MATNFPNSPAVNDTFTSNGRVWKWDGTAWRAFGVQLDAPRFFYKVVDQSRTTTTVIADDADLITTLEANSTYEFEITFFYITQNASGLRYSPNFTGTVTATKWRNDMQHNNVGTYGTTSTVTYGGAYNVLPAATAAGWASGFGPFAGSTIIKGLLITGASGGTFSLQWAQSTSSGTAATIEKGSWMKIQKIA